MIEVIESFAEVRLVLFQLVLELSFIYDDEEAQNKWEDYESSNYMSPDVNTLVMEYKKALDYLVGTLKV